MRGVIVRDLFAVVIGGVFVVLGLVVGAFFIVTRANIGLLHFGGFVICSGWYFLTASSVALLLKPDGPAWLGIELTSLYALTAFLGLLMRAIFGEGPWRAHSLVVWISTAFFFVAMIGPHVSAMSLMDTLLFHQVMSVAIMLYFMTRFAVLAVRRDVDARYFALGCSGFVLGATLDIATSMGFLDLPVHVTVFGAICMVVALAAILARRMALEFREKQKMAAGLAAAFAVQEALLPEPKRFPHADVSHAYLPADQTSGDWFLHHHDATTKRLYLFIGDVTGHGIASTLLSAVVAGSIQAMLSQIAKRHLGLDEALLDIVSAANDVVHMTGRKTGRLMTMAFIGIELETGRVSYFNAGHNELYQSHADGRVEMRLKPGDPLGFARPLVTKGQAFQLDDGDVLFAYTDGLIENVGPDRSAIKRLKLKKLLELTAERRDARAVVEHVLREAALVWLDTPPGDDVSAIAITWHRDCKSNPGES